MKELHVSTTVTREGQLVSLGLRAGVISPWLFVLIFTIDGFLQPAYSQLTEMISFLSVQAQNGWIQIANFILCGLLFLAFAGGFFQKMSTVINKKALTTATFFISLAGVAMINEGFNSTNLPGQPLGVHGTLHYIGFFVIFGSLIVAPLITGRALLKVAAWRRYGWYSIFSGLLTFVLLCGVIFSAAKFPNIVGVVNRVQIFGSFLWCSVMGLRLLAQGRG